MKLRRLILYTTTTQRGWCIDTIVSILAQRQSQNHSQVVVVVVDRICLPKQAARKPATRRFARLRLHLLRQLRCPPLSCDQLFLLFVLSCLLVWFIHLNMIVIINTTIIIIIIVMIIIVIIVISIMTSSQESLHRKNDFIHHHHPSGVVSRSFCIYSSTVAVSKSLPGGGGV